MYEELRAVIDAAEANLSNVLMHKGPYSSMWPNSSTTTAADKVFNGKTEKWKLEIKNQSTSTIETDMKCHT